MNVLALGDSIVWGQGNSDDRKFVALVSSWLQAQGLDPRVSVFAHSGAVASPTANDGALAIWGEVPEAAPSVLAQLDTAARALDPQTVDLVILDGGINDISPFHIVVADPFDPNALERLSARCSEIFSGPVQALVDRTVAMFSKARLVVTGYYPLITEQTGLRALVQLLKHLPRPPGATNFLDLTVEHLADDLLAFAIKGERQRVIDQSKLFATLSTQLLKVAVAAHASTGRVFFADPGFGPENAFAAPKTWLWSGADDPLYSERLKRYGEHALQDPFGWPLVTPLASLCHPNVAGSEAYARAIVACLG